MSVIKPYDLQLLTCGLSNTASSIPLRFPPIDQVPVKDFTELKNYVVNHAESYSFILLFLDLDNQPSSAALKDLEKKACIFATYICVKLKRDFKFNEQNVFPVAKQYITQKISSSVIQFFINASEELLRQNHVVYASILRGRANSMKDQLRGTNRMIRGCYIIIVPMNITERDLFEFQERLIDVCNDLCGDYEPTVCTLDDYFAWNESPDLFGAEGIAIKCDFIKKIAWTRIYLIGNETHNIHSFSQALFQSESNSCDKNEYNQNYTFVEYQPVTEQTKSDLSNVLGPGWQSANLQLKRLDEIRSDIKFVDALECAHAMLPAREMVANIKLNQQATDPSDDSVEISSSYQIIQQAVTGRQIKNASANEDINNSIQRSSLE